MLRLITSIKCVVNYGCGDKFLLVSICVALSGVPVRHLVTAFASDCEQRFRPLDPVSSVLPGLPRRFSLGAAT